MAVAFSQATAMPGDFMKIAPPYDVNRIYQIEIADIEADSDWNCRGYIAPMSLLELAGSIEVEGLHEPVTVIPSLKAGTKQFKLVAGYRRLAASKMINKTEIDAVIKPEMSESDARVWNLVENLQREQLNIKQEANAIKHLRFMKQDEIMKRVGMSRGWVQTREYLLRLPEDIQDEAAAGNMTSSEIRSCATLKTNDDRYEYLRRLKMAKAKGTIREVDPKKVERRAQKALRTADEIEELMDTIRALFGNGITTSCLAWAGGFISPLELHQRIKKEAEKIDQYHEIPEGLQ